MHLIHIRMYSSIRYANNNKLQQNKDAIHIFPKRFSYHQAALKRWPNTNANK